jgi:hypothetical protein
MTTKNSLIRSRPPCDNFAMSEDDFEGRRRGRPATGRGVKLTFRLPADVVARIQARADADFQKFTAALRDVIERGLNDDKK